MKNLINSLFLAGSLAINGNAFSQDAKINSINSMYQIDSIEKNIESLRQNAVNNYIESNINYNKCGKDKNSYQSCVDTLVSYILKSKKALKRYDEMIQENKKYEVHYGTMNIVRDLNSERTKEWIKNEDKLLQLIKEFSENPSMEKQKSWINQHVYTMNLVNSWLSK